MRRKYIALQPHSTTWRYAVAASDQGGTRLFKAGFFERVPTQPLADQLLEVVGRLQVSDRLAWELPAQAALFRWLDFPFSDARKIASTVSAEMSQQLPVTDGEEEIYHQRQRENRVLAVAVDSRRIEEAIESFDDNREPLGYLGLLPLTCLAALDWPEDGLLLAVAEAETLVARCENGWLTDLRILPQTGAEEHEAIVQQVALLARSHTSPLLGLKVLGRTDPDLEQALQQSGLRVEKVTLSSVEGPLADELTGVGCLALAAAKAGERGLNLRSGRYRLKNDWQALKRKLWLAAALVLTMAVALGGSGYLKYTQRAQVRDQLQQEMSRLYRQEFPGEKLVVTPTLQLQSKIKALENRAAQFGSAAPGALQVLRAVSEHTDPRLSVDIQEYLQNDEGVRLSGNTTNFDAVSKLLAALQAEPLFQDVRIIDSKQAIDGSRVDFQLQIRLKPQGAMQ